MNKDVLFTLYLVMSAILSFFVGRKFRRLAWVPYLGVGVFVIGVFCFGWFLISALL